jgi:hypothetical protein
MIELNVWVQIQNKIAGENDTLGREFVQIFDRFGIHRNNLKNRFLAASGLPLNSHSRSRLASWQGALAPNGNSADPSCQNPDSLSCFGIHP